MGIDAIFQIEGDDPEGDFPPKDSKLFAKLYFDLTQDGESMTNTLAEIYEFDLEPFYRATDTDDSGGAWHDPKEILKTFKSLLSAMEEEGEDIVGMPLEGYLLQEKDVEDLKSLLKEVIDACKIAHESQKRVRIVLG